jgi:hypothetical protein
MAVATAIWDEEAVPAELATATVVNVPKAGADPTLTDSFRGVSLIPTVLKLVDRIVIERVYKGLMARRRIRMEQAGFLKVEESMGQVCALVEAASRRALHGKATYVAYIDFRKAFDTVPHGALMHRLHSTGVRGKALRFFEALYAAAKLRVKVGGVLSEPIDLEIGVRQGAPSSPVLFDVFIDSVLDELRGMKIPALRRPLTGRQMPGLLFADDLLLSQPSRVRLIAALQKVSAWADKWGMTVNNGKCGVMVLCSAAKHEAAKRRTWLLQGRPIPVVDEYKYLGVLIDPMLTFVPNAALRVSKGRAALYALEWLLRDPTVPLAIKALVYKTRVHPVLCFGGELLGLNRNLTVRTASLQQVQNRAIKWMAIGSGRGSVGVIPVLVELGIPTVAATLAGAKVRAMVKYPSLRSWIGALSRQRAPIPRRVVGAFRLWSTCSKASATRLVPAWRSLSPKAASRSIVTVTMTRALRRKAATGVHAKVYHRSRFSSTTRYLSVGAKHFIGDAPALAWLTRARTGLLQFGYAAAAAGRIDPKYRRQCIACEEPVKDTLSHLLLDCTQYENSRHGAFKRLTEAAKALARKSLSSRVVTVTHRRLARVVLKLLLGGSSGPKGRTVSLGTRWLPPSRALAGSAQEYSEVPVPPLQVAVGSPAADGGQGGVGLGSNVAGAVAAHAALGGSAMAAPQFAAQAGASGDGGLLTRPTPGFVTVARVLGRVMAHHSRRLQGLVPKVSMGASVAANGNNDGAHQRALPPRDGVSGHRRRRRANAGRPAGQRFRDDPSVGVHG